MVFSSFTRYGGGYIPPFYTIHSAKEVIRPLSKQKTFRLV